MPSGGELLDYWREHQVPRLRARRLTVGKSPSTSLFIVIHFMCIRAQVQFLPKITPMRLFNNSNAFVNLVVRLQGAGGLSDADLANMTATTVTVVRRWRTGRAHPDIDIQLFLSRLDYTVTCLADTLPPAEIRSWLYARQRVWRHLCAAEMLRTDKADKVIESANALAAA